MNIRSVTSIPALVFLSISIACPVAWAQPSRFVMSGSLFEYGFFGAGSTVHSFGPALDSYSLNFEFPGSTATKRVETDLQLSGGGGGILQFDVNNESFLRATRLAGNDHGGGFSLGIDIYVKGPPGTPYYLERQHAGQGTAIHGGGLGTTHAHLLGLTAVVNNTAGQDDVFINVNMDRAMAGTTSGVAHPSDPQYHFATSVGVSAWNFTFQSIDFCFPGCPDVLTYRSTSSAMGMIGAGPCCPLEPETDAWNTPTAPPFTQYNNNCYNYATNRPTNTFAQPGGGGYATIDCPTITSGAVADGLTPIANPADCPSGSCVVALVIAPGPPASRTGPDFHWYRQNADGSWSHKPGQTKASTDAAGSPITDPAAAGRGAGYTIFCGYFCVPCDFEMPLPLPGPGPEGDGMIASILSYSGRPAPSLAITSPDVVASLLERLPLDAPVLEPDGWQELGYGGLAIQRLGDAPEVPEYLRMFEGTIEVVAGGVSSFFDDTAGAESFLEQVLIDSGFGADVDPCAADIAPPARHLDIFDIITYLELFDAADARADLAEPFGGFDIFDITTYLALFDEGCD
ncbi:MAG: hypothetical protein KDA28_03155 [Phycisphaerales bacterium]|nr:hypothetical protein [Phycisphaerales bacterium]